MAGIAPESILLAPYAGLLEFVEKKREYINKRLDKLRKMEDEVKKGVVLTQEKEEARKKLPEVEAQDDFLKRMAKEIKDAQRDYNRQRKSRDTAAAKREASLAVTAAEEVLLARSVFEEYNANKERYANSFTAEERTRVDILADIFYPKVETPVLLRQKITSNAALVKGILSRDPSFIVSDDLNAADAHHLLTTLIGLVETYEIDECIGSVNLDDDIVDEADEEMDVSNTSSEASKDNNKDVVTGLANGGNADDVRFGYSSEDDASKKSNSVQDGPSSEEVSESSVTPDSLESPPPTPAEKVDEKEDSEAPVVVVSETTNDENMPVSRPSTEPVEKVEEAPSAGNTKENKDAKTVKFAKDSGRRRNENGGNGGPQRRIQRSNNQQRSHEGNGQFQRRPRPEGANNGQKNVQRFANDLRPSNGQHNGGKYQAANNGHHKTAAYEKPGYVRRGGYVCPPSGTCGFTVNVQYFQQ